MIGRQKKVNDKPPISLVCVQEASQIILYQKLYNMIFNSNKNAKDLVQIVRENYTNDKIKYRVENTIFKTVNDPRRECTYWSNYKM